MNIIVDTHIYLWALADPSKIRAKYVSDLENPGNTIWLSAVSVTEMMIKASIGKIEIDFDPIAVAQEVGFDLLDYRATDAVHIKDLPFHHRDPFDRMLISQGMSRDFKIMTDDPKFSMYECKLV